MLYNFQRETTADRTRDFDTVDQRALHPKCSPSLSPAFSTLAERRLEYSYIRDIFLLANGPSDIRLLGSRNFPSREIRRRSTADFLSADGEKRSLSKRRARSPKTQPLRAARAAPFPPPGSPISLRIFVYLHHPRCDSTAFPAQFDVCDIHGSWQEWRERIGTRFEKYTAPTMERFCRRLSPRLASTWNTGQSEPEDYRPTTRCEEIVRYLRP